MNETLPIPRTTLTEMAVAYRQAEQDIRAAFGLLVEAEKRLKDAFQVDSSRFNPLDRDRSGESFDNADQSIDRLKRVAWKVLIDKMGIRSAMSIKRAKELYEQLEAKRDRHGKPVDPLPEITEANILAMMESTFNQLPAMLEEAVREVYDWLRPHRGFCDHYKTNQRNTWALGSKVIKEWMVSPGYGSPFRVNYQRQQDVTALDNVFAMLDGKGIVKTHYGPLSDAIAASKDGTGETEYFKFRACKNGNLHIEFKRADLVERFNLLAGGARLADERRAA